MNWNPSKALMVAEVEAVEVPSPEQASIARTRIAELARFDPLDYELCREEEAKGLGLRVSVLDSEVEAFRKTPVEESPKPFDDLKPWPDSVDGSNLLDRLRATINRFCVLPDHSDVLISVWIIHAHALDSADISPILCLTSPEKRCGESTTASVVAALVPRPIHTINVSPAVVFRVIEAHKPTMVIDEGDTFLRDNEDMRGLLNGGHDRRTAYVWRSVGDDHEPRQFRVWGPKVLAMIGRPPDTIVDRSLMVHLRRKAPDETVERFSARRSDGLVDLARMSARWASDNRLRLVNADPDVPDELNDRAQDNARSLCAIADAAGGEWPKIVRAALIGAAATEIEAEPRSPGVLLLTDIGDIAARWKGITIASSELLEELLADQEGPWAEW